MRNQWNKYRMTGLSLLAVCLGLTSSCSLLPRHGKAKTEKAAPPHSPLFVRSRIQHVNLELKYVLLEHFPQLALDTVHTVYRNRKAVAQVKVTGPRQYNLTAADILEGLPVKGDEIILRVQGAP